MNDIFFPFFIAQEMREIDWDIDFAVTKQTWTGVQKIRQYYLVSPQ